MPKQVLLPFRHLKKAKAYEAALCAGGMEPLPVSVDDPMPFDRAAGLLLMGGTDVNPKRYNSDVEPETDPPDDARDQVELDLIHAALERDLPILAICRGLQILNVCHGGTLIQHLGAARHDPEKDDHSGPAHEIEFSPGSRLAQIACVPRWQVNSRHHQAVARGGPFTRLGARSRRCRAGGIGAARQTFCCRRTVAPGRSDRPVPRADQALSEFCGCALTSSSNTSSGGQPNRMGTLEHPTPAEVYPCMP